MWRSLGTTILVASVLACPALAAASSAARTDDLPAGIMLAGVRIGAPASSGTADGALQRGGRAALAFADSGGLPLYTFTGDTPGKSACYGDCLKTWRPALAAVGARPQGDWSIVKRDDGARQWAFRAQPLYSFVNETQLKDDPHMMEVRSPPGVLRRPAGQGLNGAWSVAEVEPAKWFNLPVGFSTEEALMAPGQVLVTLRGEPLYAFSGGRTAESGLPDALHPYRAAMMDLPVGEFTIRKRSDGSLQWAYRGAPLYTFDGDFESGDLNGENLAPGLSPVVLLHYFLPKGVVLQKDQKEGGRLVDEKTGHTIYVRDRSYYAGISNYIRVAGRLNPLTGASIGLAGCDAQCERTWSPVVAPKDAQPGGYFTVLDRPDGTKQWAYRGYALYTHPGEPPGSTYGADTWTVSIDHGLAERKPDNLGMGLFWRAAIP